MKETYHKSRRILFWKIWGNAS